MKNIKYTVRGKKRDCKFMTTMKIWTRKNQKKKEIISTNHSDEDLTNEPDKAVRAHRERPNTITRGGTSADTV